MNKRKVGFSLLALAVVVGGWAAFRPERLFIDKTVNEALEDATSATVGPRLLSRGIFHSNAHETRGTASILARPDGSHLLRLEGFETSNGPDVQVYLVRAMDVQDNATVEKAGFVNVGALKGNVGDQNYEIPVDVDVDAYRAVTIWCRRFGVNFGTAPLMTTQDEQLQTQMRSARAIGSGMFHGVAHETHGTATLYALPGGQRVLRFTDFETSNGPDVQVYLVAAQDATDSETVKQAGFIPLAALKGNVGDQNYELPGDVDLERYRAVTIWCRRFGVNFGTAPLQSQNS